MSALDERLAFALSAAREAGSLILNHYQNSDLAVELKGDRSPVTAADRGAEQLLRDRIAERYPDDGVLGEEFEDRESASGFRWILDPVDGTQSFVHGVPLFGTLIGLESDERMVLGVCRFPALDEVVYAATDSGAWWQVANKQPKRARVTATSKLSDALFCTTTITGWQSEHQRSVFTRLCARTRLTRGWSDCYGHMLVATGRADLMVDPVMNPWDAAALLPIVQQAGGHFLGWNGEASIHTGDGISVNDALKDSVLEVLD